MDMHMVKASDWFYYLEVGGKELILSLEDSHLESFQLIILNESSRFRDSLQIKTAVDSVNSARYKKGLPSISFSFDSELKIN